MARRPKLLSRSAANWLHLERLRPVDDGRVVTGPTGEREFEITCRTPNDSFDIPRCCLFQNLKMNGTKVQRYRHRRMQPLPTYLRVARQRFKCLSCEATIYENLPDVHDGHKMTKALEGEIFLSTVKRSFDDAATFHQIKKATARRIFLENARAKLKDYEIELPRVLGVDENRILKGDRFVCADIEGGKILDMLETRDIPTLLEYFGSMAYHYRVEVFCQDMWAGYKTVAEKMFPNALVVIDKFHVVRYANEKLDRARASFQYRLPNEDRKWLKGKRRLLLKRWDDLGDEGQDKVAEITQRYPEIGDAYAWKEKFYDLYDLADRATAEAAFTEWDESMPKHLARFFRPISRMVKKWHGPIFNYYDARYTSGMVENLNGRINAINKRGFGYDFETLRMKAILRYGNIIPLGDLAAFDWMGHTDEEIAYWESRAVVRGFDPATLERAIARGHF